MATETVARSAGRRGSGIVRLPARPRHPLRALGARLAVAIGLIVLVVVVVYFGRSGYRDNQGGQLSLLDAAYYTVVSLSTTGYGDITPITPKARFINVFLVTPARVLFLIILVGTTLEVLTEQFRSNIRLERWRQTVKDHCIVCGYGTTGQNAIKALLDSGTPRSHIVVVDPDPAAIRQATAAGFAAVEGDATRGAVLRHAHIASAKSVIVSTSTDDTAVLVTLTVRQLTGNSVRVVASVREAENAPLLQQSGAHQVVVSAATAGQLLGLATHTPPIVSVIEDLLTPGHGMAIAARDVTAEEVGRNPRELTDLVIALVRRGQVRQLAEPQSAPLLANDMVVYIRDDRHTATEAH